MKKFILFYYAPAEAMAGMATATPEEKAKGMEPWMAWKEKAGDHVVDFGAPVMPVQQIDSSGAWSASQDAVTGYSILQANSLEDLKPLLADHPHINWAPGCTIAISEFVAM